MPRQWFSGKGNSATCCIIITQSVIIGVLLAAIALLLISVVVVGFRRSHTFHLVPGDTLLYDYSPWFCSKITLESNTISGLCLIKQSPVLVAGDRLNFANNFSLNYDGHKSWEFHLHNGSRVNVSICAVIGLVPIQRNSKVTPHVDFYFLDEVGYTDWKNHHLDCADTTACLHVSLAESCGDHNTTYSKNVSHSKGARKYYFVIQSRHQATVNIGISLSINRTEFNITDLQQLCTTTTASEDTVELHTTFGHEYPAVIYVDDRDMPWDQEYDSVTVYCDPQWGVNVSITVTVFLLMTAICFSLNCFLSRYIYIIRRPHNISPSDPEGVGSDIRLSESERDQDTIVTGAPRASQCVFSRHGQHYDSHTHLLIEQDENV